MGSTNTAVDMEIKPETITYALTAEQVNDGVDAQGQPKFKTELKAISREKDIAAAKEKGIVIVEQTFSYDRAGSVSGISKVIKDDEEAVNIFNSGLKIKLNSRIKAMLEEQDDEGNPAFQPVEGTYDMRADLNEPAQRRNLSPTDKALKVLIGLGMTREIALGLLQNAQAQQQGQSVEATA